jgi:putative sterol carrier protein
MNVEWTPREFFEQQLPEVLRARGDHGISGTLAFAISGAGEWTVDLQSGGVVSGFAEAADFSLRMPVEDFAAMILGDFDAEAAVAAGRMSAQGDLALLAAFGALIEPMEDEEN